MEKFLFRKTTFDACSADPYGGAFMINEDSNHHADLILSFVCGVDCQAKSSGQFESVDLSGNENYKTIGYIYDSSIVSNQNVNDGDDVILHNACDIEFNMDNITNNICESTSPFSIAPYHSSSLSYLLIRNNTANSHICCYFRGNIQHKIEHSNILNNKQKQNNYGVICLENKATFNHCYIYNNINEGNGNIIYSIGREKSIFNDCFIDEDQLKYTGSVSFNLVSSAFFNSISMSGTRGLCYGGIETIPNTFHTNSNNNNNNNKSNQICTCYNFRFNCLLFAYHSIFIHSQL